MQKLTVIGSGAWGIALACTFSDKFDKTIIWSYLAEEANSINQNKESEFLPGIVLKNIQATRHLKDAVTDAAVIISAIPSFSILNVWTQIKDLVDENAVFINASKGLDACSQKFPYEIFAELFNPKIEYFSLCGPSFAIDVAKHSPTGVVLAGKNKVKAQKVISQLQTEKFFLNYSADVIGVELCAVMKNVIAVASGIVVGMGYGPNTQALIVVQGLKEIMLLGQSMGAQRETFSGEAGMGDLLLTAMNRESRNMTLGMHLGRGMTIQESLKQLKGISEGYEIIKILERIIAKYNLDLPIMKMVIAVVMKSINPTIVVLPALKKSFNST